MSYFLSISFLQVYSQQKEFKILHNQIVDSTTHTAIPYATITLIGKSNQPKKIIIGQKDGFFKISAPDTAYIGVNVTCSGYVSKYIAISYFDHLQNRQSPILLQQKTNQLKEVNIISAKPIIKREIDRLSYNVQADPEKNIISVGDILQKMPMVSSDGSSLLVKGSTSYRIFIDGRPSALFSNNPLSVLKTMNADNILRVEIITTPPSKYESEGLIGIINIVTVKNGPQGYTVKIGARYTSPDGPSGSGAFSIKNGKFGLSAYGGDSELKEPKLSSSLYRTSSASSLQQNSVVQSKTHFPYGHMESSYEIDSLNLLTLTLNYSGNNGNRNTNQITHINAQSTQQLYNLISNSKYSSSALDIGINYEIKLNTQRNEILTASYNSLLNRENTDAGSSIIYTSPAMDMSSIFLHNKSGSNEHTAQLDYTNTIRSITIEAGGKGIFRRNFSDFNANNFNYHQNVYALYNTYTLKHKAFEYKAGARLERTVISFEDSSKFRRTYTNAVPSISILDNLNERSSLNLGYSIRIERPGIIELNPFVDRSDPRSISTGNPYLNPSLSNNLELNYSYFNNLTINSGLSYNHVSKGMDIVTTYDPDNDAYTSTYQNAINSSRVGFNNSITIPFKNKSELTFNSDLSYNQIRGTVNETHYENQAYLINLYASLSKKFGNNLSVTLNSSYNNGILLLQGRSNHTIFYSGSATKYFLNKKLALSGVLNNPFSKFRSYIFKTNADNSNQVFNSQNYYRKLSVGLSYKFGQLKSSIKLNQRGINNDDLKN